MDKKEAFKEFVRKHPSLTRYIKNNNKTWQNLYEIYDIYGDDDKAWEPYFEETKSTNNTQSTSNFDFKDVMKNIDLNQIQEHIKSAQKALGFIEELTSKGASNLNNLPKGHHELLINRFICSIHCLIE